MDKVNDEAYFLLDVCIISHNWHIWGFENPFIIVEKKSFPNVSLFDLQFFENEEGIPLTVKDEFYCNVWFIEAVRYQPWNIETIARVFSWSFNLSFKWQELTTTISQFNTYEVFSARFSEV